MNERWKKIRGHSACYEVSSLGRIRNRKTGLIMTPQCIHKERGYMMIRLYNSLTKTYSNYHVSHLVCRAFNPKKRFNHTDVIHLDCDNRNNEASNLMWATSSACTMYRRLVGKKTNLPRRQP